MNSTSFKYLFFDLDDTLLNTSELLIPQAVKKAFEFILPQISNKTFFDLNLAIKSWEFFKTKYSGRDLFFKIILELTNDSEIAKEYSHLAYTNFLEPRLPPTIPIEPYIENLLQRLNKKYHLILITQGNPQIQLQKILKMNISNYFKDTLIINALKQETKTLGFKQMIEKYNIQNPDLEGISIGNRLCHEIAMAKQLGFKTCYLKKGEHAHEVPQNEFENPDWTILQLQDLEKTCNI